jgi:hypothetical protein
MCGEPSAPSREGFFLCAECLQRYDEQLCSRCGIRMVVLKSIEHSGTCSLCELRAKVNDLPMEAREAICRLAKSGQRLEAIKEAKRVLDVSLGDAAFVAEELAK